MSTHTHATAVIPKPYKFWTPLHQRMVFPLYMLFSVAWGLEMYVHSIALLTSCGPDSRDFPA